jgi:hypothetical protein
MKFLVQLQVKPECRNKAMEAFELRGPNRNPGVTLKQAWVDTRSHIVFALAESADEASVEKAGQSWAEFGDY